MQRDKVAPYPKIARYKPILLWEECRFCHREFRKEYGYAIKELSTRSLATGPQVETTYCCKDCAGSLNEVRLKIELGAKELELLKNKPPKRGSGIK